MSTELVPTAGAALATPAGYTAEHVALIKGHVMQSVQREPSDVEFRLFLANCQRTGLDPLLRQIYCIERRQNSGGQWVSKFETQISIDGARLVAERTSRYEGQVGPFWCGADGVWYDVWAQPTPPSAAKVGVWRAGFREPLWSVAHYAEYVQTTKDGRPTRFWERMPALMLAKCAEALALRKAFPFELSGLYTPEEMSQAQSEAPIVIDAPATTERQRLIAELRSLVTEARGLGLEPPAMGKPADMTDTDLRQAAATISRMIEAERGVLAAEADGIEVK